jgi:hypothetical protein
MTDDNLNRTLRDLMIMGVPAEMIESGIRTMIMTGWMSPGDAMGSLVPSYPDGRR